MMGWFSRGLCRRIASTHSFPSCIYIFFWGLTVLLALPSASGFSTVPLLTSERNLPNCIRSANNNNNNHNTDDILLSDGSLCKETFQELYSEQLPPWLLERCESLGYVNPSRIQRVALDKILLNTKKRNDDDASDDRKASVADDDDSDNVLQDVMVQAETGSGKTLAYLLPALSRLDPSRAAVQALVVVPTRELGLQVARVAKRLAAGYTTTTSKRTTADKILIMSVLQGSQNRRQRAWAWADPPHLVIGTPQELCDMVRLGGIKRYNSVTYVVVDEVDACLLQNSGSLSLATSATTLHQLLSKYLSPTYDDGLDQPDVLGLASSETGIRASRRRPVSTFRQTVFCSATLPQPRHFIKQCRQNQWTLQPTTAHVCLRTGEQLLPPTIQHAYIVTDVKLAALTRVLQRMEAQLNDGDDDDSTNTGKKVLVFAEPQRPLEEMALSLASKMQDGIYYRDSNSEAAAKDVTSIFSVLRLEDSLSQRAAALDVFRGDGYSTGGDAVGNAAAADGASGSAPNRPKMLVLLSTDLAARGLDIVDITHVLHFDLPPDPDTYVHRAGRTGRWGRSGQVISMVLPAQEFVLTRIVNKLGLPSESVQCLARQRKKKSA